MEDVSFIHFVSSPSKPQIFFNFNMADFFISRTTLFVNTKCMVDVPGSVGQDRTTGPGTLPVNSSPEIRILAKRKSIILTRKESHCQVISF